MADPLANPQNLEMFTEVYEVVRAVIVRTDLETYRIEVFKRCRSSIVYYMSFCWIEKNNMWLRYDIHSGEDMTADDALNSAFASLKIKIGK